MVKFLKPNKAVIILQGRYARKAVIVNNYDDGTRDRAYGHCLVAVISNYPKKVICKDSAKKTAKKSRVKAFVKVVNYSHIMPTRYTLDVDLKDIATANAFQSKDKKLTTAKEIKSRFEDRFKTDKNSVWRKKKKEDEEVTVGGLSRSFDSFIILVLPYPSRYFEMDKTWISLPRNKLEYAEGLNQFLDFAFANKLSDNRFHFTIHFTTRFTCQGVRKRAFRPSSSFGIRSMSLSSLWQHQ